MGVQIFNYDSKEGIEEYIKTLEGLNRLKKDRREAYGSRKIFLNDWIIFGTWVLDGCGNFMKMGKSYRHEVPSVITKEEFFKFTSDGYSAGMNSYIPPENVECSLCGKKWSVDNCEDAISVSSRENKSLNRFVGKPISEVIEFFSNKKDAVYRIQPDLAIRNDRWIDLTPVPEYSTMKVNPGGYAVLNGESREGYPELADDYIIQKGDEAYFNVTRYYHKKCNDINVSIKQQKEYSKIFYDSGFHHIFMRAIENQYCECNICSPWYEIDTIHGTFVVGWRKRVISIDISRIDSSLELDKLFEDEDVTKGTNFIHAWGVDKAVEYIRTIRCSLDV
jgi:hypothetical protein